MGMFRTASGRSNMEVAACHRTWPKVPCAVLFLPPPVCSEGPRPYVPAVQSTLAAACPERICDGSGLQQRHPCRVILSRQRFAQHPRHSTLDSSLRRTMRSTFARPRHGTPNSSTHSTLHTTFAAATTTACTAPAQHPTHHLC